MRMTHSLQMTMTRILKNVVADERTDSSIDGIVVFGSYVKNTLHEKSDLDVFVLDSSHSDYYQIRKMRQGIIVEFYRWPTPFFRSVLYSDNANIYPKAFLFKILREGKIKHDPQGILQKARTYVSEQSIPQISISPLLQRTHDSLELASIHIDNQRYLLAEIEIRMSSENLGRLLLLRKHILDINPPKYYLPSLREVYPDFYDSFCVIHNLKMLKYVQIKRNVCRLKKWIATLRLQDYSSNVARGKSTNLANAETELAHAEDCLRNNDYEAAELQTRYAALYLVPLFFHQNDTENTPDLTIARLLRSNHAYQRVLLSILNCAMNKDQLHSYLEDLVQLKLQYARASN